MRVKQEEMRLHTEMELLFKNIRRRVIDIQVNKIDPSSIFLRHTLDYWRHRQAWTAPERKELD